MEPENQPESNEPLQAASEVLLLPPHQSEIIALLTAGTAPEIKSPPEWLKYRIRGYIVSITVSTLILYLVNNLLNIYVPWIPGDFSKFFWNILNNVYNHVEITFLAKTFSLCLWAINLYLLLSMLGNFVLLLYRPRWFHHLMQAVIAGLAVLPAHVLYKIYPFVFEQEAVNSGIKAGLIAIMVAMGIWATFEFAMFIKSVLLELRGRAQKKGPLTQSEGGPTTDATKS
jgi:hypothetical protein